MEQATRAAAAAASVGPTAGPCSGLGERKSPKAAQAASSSGSPGSRQITETAAIARTTRAPGSGANGARARAPITARARAALQQRRAVAANCGDDERPGDRKRQGGEAGGQTHDSPFRSAAPIAADCDGESRGPGRRLLRNPQLEHLRGLDFAAARRRGEARRPGESRASPG